jgi:integrase
MASSPLPHTLGHVNCPACEATRIEAMRTSDLKDLSFDNAATLWLQDRQLDIGERTHKDHQDFARRLGRFFGGMALKDIHIGHIKAYQLARQGKDRALDLGKAGPELVNHEISFLTGLLDAAGTWKPMKQYYRCLKVKKSTRGRSITEEEEDRLKMVAASNPRWQAAYLGTLLSLNTTAGPGEIVHIRVRWINMRDRVLSIRDGLKNDSRERHFPMTGTIHWICSELLKRYYRLCRRHGLETSEEHYVLMGRTAGSGRPYDPWKPMGSWKKAWGALTEKADLPGLRMYDMRHQTQTKLMEQDGVSDHTIEDIAGHISGDMKKQYRHIRDKKKLEALEMIESRPAPKIIETPDGELVEVPVLPKTSR